MTPQRRTALVSIVAASFLLVLKLATGLATDSLGLLSEALHSGTDLVAALPCSRATRNEISIRLASTAMITSSTAIAHQAISSSGWSIRRLTAA